MVPPKKGIEGTYRISFDKKNISLNCKDDECKERKNVLETEWEWIEIDNLQFTINNC